MELVKGIAITDYCDQNQLMPRERLSLFASVCQAVQHAHTKGVVHRDLKPSNILVTLHDGTPVVKVIDFGVAKAIGQNLTDKTIYTHFTQMIGTPVYMSPEQAEMSGLDIDTRSDVYSLGVLLYELLTGTTPFDRKRLHEAAFDEIRRIIREEEPPRPSTRLTTLGEGLSVMSAKRRTEPAKLSALFQGELDWIVMKALEKDRTRRYETASAMAEDVRRFLNDELVEARPPSAWYRFRKMARRNKAAMTTAALVAATLLLGFVVSAWQAVRATRAEDDALASAEQAATNVVRALAGERLARDNGMKAAASAALAMKQEQVARDNAIKAAASAALAKNNEFQAKMGLYASNIARAQRELEADNLSIFYQHLEKCSPDFRGWEHDYLYTQVNQNLQTLARQNNAVSRVAFSPDGNRLATAAPRKTVKLWDVATGKELLTVPMQEEVITITSLAFSPDGKRLATSTSHSGPGKGAGGGRGGASGAVKLWDTVSGKEIWSQNENARVSCVAFSPDGKRLVTSGGMTASENKGQPTSFVKLWDATTGQAILSLSGHEKPVRGVAFSPDGRRLATASDDALVKLWELASGKEYMTLKGHTDLVGRVTFSPDGKRLATASIDKTLKVWDAASGQEILTVEKILTLGAFPIDVFALSVAFSPDGKLLASAYDRTVMLLDAASGQEVASFKGHTGIVKSVAFSPDGKSLASAAGEVRIWDVPASLTVLKFQWLSTFKKSDNPEFIPVQSNVAFSPDGKRVAAGLRDKTLKIWDLASRQEVLALQGVTCSNVTFSPDGNRLAGGSNETVMVWDVANGQKILTCKGHTDLVTHVAFSPDGNHLASASEDETVKIWDAISGEHVWSLQHTKDVFSLAFSPDGKRLACASIADKTALTDNKTLKVWDAASGQEILNLNNFIHAYSRQRDVEFSPDGKLLASAANETVKLWDAASGREVANFKGHTDRVNWVAFSPDGKRLASASFDKTVKLWDVASCQEVLTLTATVYSLAFSPDGKRLVGGSNGAVKLWDTVNGQEVLSLRNKGEVNSLAFSPDGKRLAVKSAGSLMSGGDMMILWDASKSMTEQEQK